MVVSLKFKTGKILARVLPVPEQPYESVTVTEYIPVSVQVILSFVAPVDQRIVKGGKSPETDMLNVPELSSVSDVNEDVIIIGCGSVNIIAEVIVHPKLSVTVTL